MNDQKNLLLAIALSALVLIGWHYFIAGPQMERQRQEAIQKQAQTTTQPAAPGTPTAPGTAPQTPGHAGAPPVAAQKLTREQALAASGRIQIETPRLKGSIALKGGRIDDLSLLQYRETIDPKSPPVVLLAPTRSPHPYYAQFGWLASEGSTVKLPDNDTEWRQEGSGTLAIGRPVTLVYDNGAGLEFRRIISVDDKYLFTVEDKVTNKGTTPVVLYPYALISRHGTPETLGYIIMHEGLIGVLPEGQAGMFGNKDLKELSYSDIEKAKQVNYKATNAWLGITDKYWAATLIPDTKAEVQAQFRMDLVNGVKTYETNYRGQPQTIQPGATGSNYTRLFAGAKEVAIVDGYNEQLHLKLFDRLIDWGWFFYITKPMFYSIDWLFQLVKNFGVAILLVTLIIKIIFLPLANKAYASMAKMKAVQPQMMAIRERYPDDKMKQQQELMDLYKKEKINPLAGCLPILIQIPVFFALYKVLFISIEMRHAPFFGWIKDLSAPDPTTIFNLFGLIPWDPSVVPLIGPFLMIGIWPIIMGITMWVQMKLNPAPPDPTQQMIFDWMPVIFTFMLAGFSAGLVIYWAWNNTLSVLQQSYIMRRHGTKIELWDNVKALFPKRKTEKIKGAE
jgi:YidC/Oxa1 family membrane protein insertase